jgi:hypothetical protein
MNMTNCCSHRNKADLSRESDKADRNAESIAAGRRYWDWLQSLS